jgi:hypothetical protein
MALIDSASASPGPSDWRTSRGFQEYLAWLEKQERVTSEPFEPVEKLELVDGEPPAPNAKPTRRHKRAKLEEATIPTVDRDLRLLARKLKG